MTMMVMMMMIMMSTMIMTQGWVRMRVEMRRRLWEMEMIVWAGGGEGRGGIVLDEWKGLPGWKKRRRGSERWLKEE
ncbi:hypothetical protein EV426DRAFT_594212 [Tirmania nivea]|nr:hypothetical protein EV426DRAFT_594212 [Tirmania nivea]